MSERYLIHDNLIAWYGSKTSAQQLLGLSVFTQTVDTFAPHVSGRSFRRWLICSQTASGVASDLVAIGPPGCFDSLLQSHGAWFAEGSLIACPVWEYRICAPGNALITEVGSVPGPGPDLDSLIRKLGI